jgi:type II secretory pathway pseudopilin PulG
MNKSLKITLIVVGSLAVAGGITFGIVRRIRKRNEQKEELEKELQESQALQQVQQELEATQDTKDDKIIPVRNLDKGINNSFKEINGVKLYPAKKSNDPVQGHPFAEGFANIRETPEVNNSQGIWDLWQDNLLGKVSAGASIGTIVSEQYDNMTPKMRWFKVKLSKPIDGENYGWVRGDNVTFQPFTKKKSSFEGDFVQKYNNSYQLGADVFPHPNWMIQYRAYAGDEVSSNFSGDLDLDF